MSRFLSLISAFVLLAFSFLGCASSDSSVAVKREFGPRSNSDAVNQSIYVFQHRFLAKLVLENNARLMGELKSGDLSNLRNIATNTVSAVFAEQIKWHAWPEGKGYVVEFMTPENMPQCYFVAVVVGEKNRYFTLEKSEDLLGSGLKAFLCEWTLEGHRNHQPMMRVSMADFQQAILALPAGP